MIQLKRSKPAERKKKPQAGISAAAATAFKRLRSVPLGLPLIILGLIGTLYFTTDIFRPTQELSVYSPPAPVFSAAPVPEIKPKTFDKSEPTNLTIPDISLKTTLTTVGKQADNTLEVPVSADIPGWYRFSPTPGELGPSIIVGHVDSPKGPGVFWRLRELKAGQIIEIKRADGSITKFEVTTIRQFEQDNFPTQEVYGNIDHAGLRLITCGGTFNRLTGNYSHNIVVFASLVE